MEELQAKHRKELKDLQALVTQRKKSASKKTRKGVNDECAKLEAELKERQEQEVAELNGDVPVESRDDVDATETDGDTTDAVTNGVASLSVNGSAAPQQNGKIEGGGGGGGGSKKPNRQKARLARRAAEREEEVAKAEEEAASMPDLRAHEQETMNSAIKAKGLRMKEIRADGHCLYSAVADQLKEREIGLAPRIRPSIVDGEEEYRTVRRTCAEYITRNREEFEPFLEEDLGSYVRKVGETGEWGGQLELLALAKAYEIDISVLDGNGGVHEIEGAEERDEKRRIWLAYYRHGFGLGEHYNSLRKDG